jgi:glycosyltransferase involved in cell wall biosynthesis
VDSVEGTALRVGVVAPPWVPVPPPAYGGIETVLDTLVRGLQASGHEVVLAAHPASTAPVRLVGPTTGGGTYRMGEVVGEAAHVLGAHALLDAAGVDVIHDHTIVGPVLARRPGSPPMVTTHHGPFDADLRSVFLAAARQATVVGISHAQVRAAAPVPVDRVIHHGLDLERFPVGDGTVGYLAFIGRMCPEKGVVEAVTAARAVGLPIRVAAKVREPEELEYFESHVRHLLGDEVEFLGELGHADKVQLLAGAIALCNPVQWDEPFGLVMVEAMACGAPVVAYRRGSAPELVDHGVTGWLVDDHDQLVAALQDLAGFDRSVCRQHVAQWFSAGRMVDDHVALYRSVLTPPRRARQSATREEAPGDQAR